MIGEIKIIVENYLNNIKLCSIMLGTVVYGGIKVSDKLTIPDVLISGSLKSYTSIGDQARLIRNHGGQQFYIVEIIGKEFITKGSTITLSNGGVAQTYKVEDVVK